jgi:sec-independent protein translocase protein TatB
MFGIGSTEILVIAVVGLLVLGPRKLPQIAKTVAKGMAQFRRVSSDLQNTVEREVAKEEDNLRKEETKTELIDKNKEDPATEQTAEAQTTEAQTPVADEPAPADEQTEDAKQPDAPDETHNAEVDAVSSPIPEPSSDDTAVATATTPEVSLAENTDAPASTEVSKA